MCVCVYVGWLAIRPYYMHRQRGNQLGLLCLFHLACPRAKGQFVSISGDVCRRAYCRNSPYPDSLSSPSAFLVLCRNYKQIHIEWGLTEAFWGRGRQPLGNVDVM